MMTENDRDKPQKASYKNLIRIIKTESANENFWFTRVNDQQGVEPFES